ncbi:S-layer homology domain-containing protein [Pelotomaculum sp. PtaB.Bin117]|uniref:S-layer homology domain-containing protein n=1 Tax=Pelotomaculum sp. PtaB.Bin117 TaxID=1811694 RepID=UPI0009C743A9|nr:S-layer homology domain-containing protein [Pelotomaculum sp. PtaB.Bin117]OPX91677.1 MAG: Endo-1,4-beta-xylanase A precursor [Pelotomaculum sp. PtaB.Bin117]
MSFYLYQHPDVYDDSGTILGANDYIQTQISFNGGAWVDLGPQIKRVDGTGWVQHTITFTCSTGDTVRIGLLGYSDYGYNLYVDDLSIVQNSTPQTCTVTYDPEGGTVTPVTQTKLFQSAYGKAADGMTSEPMPIPDKPGNIFGGWYDGDNGTGNQITDATAVDTTSNHTLYAKWIKILTADTTDNNVDNDIEITFGADAAFEGAITGVSFGGTALTVTTDYVVSSGRVTLKPSGGNAVLQTPATADVVITAPGYNSSTVSQTIEAGAVHSLTVTQQPVPGAASGDAFGTQPVVTLKDRYGNICSTGPSATANVVAAAKAGTGTWTIGGTTTKAAVAGVATFTDLTCTLSTAGNGAITFTSTVTVDSNVFDIPANPGKALTADTTDNNVDNDIEITFGADAAFEGAITGVSFGGTALTVTTDYVVSSGKVTLKPSGGNAVLQTPATADVVITAPGYNSSTVSQTINHGAAITMVVTQNITAPDSNGGQFAQQPQVTLKDTYGNTCTNDNTTVVTASKVDTGDWILTGTVTVTASAGVATFTNLGATNASAVTDAQLAFDTTGLTRITSAKVNLPATSTPTLAITTVSLPNGTVGALYSATLTASGGTAPYTWSATGLPLGLILDTVSGQVYGNPVSAGNSTVSATVYDYYGSSDSASFTLTVNPASGLTISTSSLPGGRVGISYSATLIATGGTEPYTWTATGLPAGLTINQASGLISGIPTSVGTSTVSATVYDSGGQSTGESFILTITRKSSGKGPSTSPTQQPTSPSSNVEIMVNGKVEAGMATASTTTVGDRTVTTVVLDPQKLEEKLKQEGENSVVTIPVSTDADTVIGQLTGQMVKSMEQKSAVVEIKTENASYTLPAAQINIDDVSAPLGQNVELKDINVNIDIARSTDETVQFVEDAAEKNNYTIVVPPVDFKVTCTYGNKIVEVTHFNAFVERTIAIPEGIDPQRITTAVIVNSDGTFTHVPTKIIVRDGKYYAVVNSLTNSTYTVIWHPKAFKDVESHWAKDYVNEMGSRLVVSGVDENNYSPDREVTRAEFAAIIVRALGLGEKGNKNNFKDVSDSDWFNGAVSTAYAYGIINGYNDGTFNPNKAISREEAMVIIAGAAKLAGIDADSAGPDVDAQLAKFKDNESIDSWARNSAAACVKSGIMVGDDSMLTPDHDITRAEAATIVMRMLQKAELI